MALCAWEGAGAHVRGCAPANARARSWATWCYNHFVSPIGRTVTSNRRLCLLPMKHLVRLVGIKHGFRNTEHVFWEHVFLIMIFWDATTVKAIWHSTGIWQCVFLAFLIKIESCVSDQRNAFLGTCVSIPDFPFCPGQKKTFSLFAAFLGVGMSQLRWCGQIGTGGN